MHTKQHSVAPLREKGMWTLMSMFILFGVAVFSPVQASASTQAIVRQVLPSNAQTCPAFGASDVRAYVYDGNLHSFDITITDPSYVAVAGKVGKTPFPWRQVSRWNQSNGMVRLHVDVPQTPIASAVPITITLISAHPGGKPITCVVTITAPRVTVILPTRVTTSGQGTGASIHPPQQQVTPIVKPSAIPVSANENALRSVTVLSSIGTMCNVPHGPTRLWSVLIVLYALFVGLLVMRKDSFLKDKGSWNTVLIVGMFLVLAAFWLFVATCRTSVWAPILITLIACAGMLGLVYGGDDTEGMPLLLKGSSDDSKRPGDKGQGTAAVSPQNNATKGGAQNKGAL